jgi:hypothetical protein
LQDHGQEDEERQAAATPRPDVGETASEQQAGVVATASSGLRASQSAGASVTLACGAVSARRSPRIQQIEGYFFSFEFINFLFYESFYYSSRHLTFF